VPAVAEPLAAALPAPDTVAMDWQDEGMLLFMRPHGEASAIIEMFTAAHGRHAGVVRGGASRRMAPVLQPGAQLSLTWRARLDDHLGTFAVEPLRSRAALLSDRRGLAALGSICAMLRAALPERQAHPRLWAATMRLVEALMTGPDWATDYLRWEALLLEEIGFGLDLGTCAVTGATTDLAYVSPRTGRAVSRAGAGDWADRLLPLPACLLADAPAGPGDVLAGLAITGHFLTREVHGLGDPPVLPAARGRLIDLLGR
jgi:DNA repair protein RecO (recombination protein O)